MEYNTVCSGLHPRVGTVQQSAWARRAKGQLWVGSLDFCGWGHDVRSSAQYAAHAGRAPGPGHWRRAAFRPGLRDDSYRLRRVAMASRHGSGFGYVGRGDLGRPCRGRRLCRMGRLASGVLDSDRGGHTVRVASLRSTA
ncbi:hypothetical protein D3C79_737660 [compost metagenome]